MGAVLAAALEAASMTHLRELGWRFSDPVIMPRHTATMMSENR
jgi:hypothetical protein